MRLALLVGEIDGELRGSTTVRLAYAAHQRGHEVWLIGAGDLAVDIGGRIRARARRGARAKHDGLDGYLEDVRGAEGIAERIEVSGLDALLLRVDPAIDGVARPWALGSAVLFGRLAARHGVIVLNLPGALHRSFDELAGSIPAELRPRTLVTRDPAEIRALARDRGTIVLQPARPVGAPDIFVVRPEDLPTLNPMVESVSRAGYVVAREQLPEEESEGELCLFLMNGEPLRHKGRTAAFRRQRLPAAAPRRSRATVDDAALRIAAAVKPSLAAEGVFLATLSIAGGRLLGIDAACPGGLASAYEFERVPFSAAIIDALERKVAHARECGRAFDEVAIATY